MGRIDLTVVFLVGTVATAACTDGAIEDIEGVAQGVLRGKPCSTCQWPTALGGGGCTVTLVHPRVITTAKHCGTPRTVTFGETRNQNVRSVAVERCFQAASGDFAFCLLSQEVNDVPIVPLLAKCEAERIIKPGTKLTIVGFGRLSESMGSGGRKHWGETEIIQILGNGNTVALGDGQVASCFGDSGGPAYVKMPDGTWRMFASTSGAYGGGGCPGRSRYNYIPFHLAWMEQQSGIDLTPCHDAMGRWDPTPACAAIPTNPDEGVGTWADMCKAITVAQAQDVCSGAPPPPAPDGGRRDADPRDVGGAQRDLGGGGADRRATADVTVPDARPVGNDGARPEAPAMPPVADAAPALPPPPDAAATTPQPGADAAGGAGRHNPDPTRTGCACALGSRGDAQVGRGWAALALLALALVPPLRRRARRLGR